MEVLQAHWGGAGSDNNKEALLNSSFFSPDLFGPVPESIVQNCVKNPALILKPRKSSSRDSPSSQSSSSSSSTAHENSATEAGASSSDSKS